MDNRQLVGLSMFLVGAVFAPFFFLIGPLFMVPGLIILLLVDRKGLPCKNCNALFRLSQRICPKCGAPRI